MKKWMILGRIDSHVRVGCADGQIDQSYAARFRLRLLPNFLAAAIVLAVISPAGAVIGPAKRVTSAVDQSLRSTRWNIATYMYVLFYGRYDRAGSETNIAYAARLGFNAVRFNVWWYEIYPNAEAVKKGGNWEALDHDVDYAIEKGLKVILTVTLRRHQDGLVFERGDCVMDSEGALDSDGGKTTRMSFSGPRSGRAIRFFQQVGQRYRDRQNAGHILAISPVVTRDAEFPFNHPKTEDFNPAFIAEFRSWLAGRYRHSLPALNEAWGSQSASFDKVQPPPGFGGTAGHDWYRFRDLKVRQFVDSCCAALAAIPGMTTPYRVLLDYGNVGDPPAWRRGSLNFPFHAANPMVWAVKQNDDHHYDQRYTGSLLGANMQRMNKLAFNEYFYYPDKAAYPHGDVEGDSCREIRRHYDQGMNGVSYLGVQNPSPGLEAIVTRLKAEGVWSAPVTRRKMDDAGSIHVKLSTLLDLNGWQIKERYFDPAFGAGRQQVNIVIDSDFTDALLPIIPPQN